MSGSQRAEGAIELPIVLRHGTARRHRRLHKFEGVAENDVFDADVGGVVGASVEHGDGVGEPLADEYGIGRDAFVDGQIGHLLLRDDGEDAGGVVARIGIVGRGGDASVDQAFAALHSENLDPAGHRIAVVYLIDIPGDGLAVRETRRGLSFADIDGFRVDHEDVAVGVDP